MNTPSDQQRALIEAPEDRVLGLAGPGSGKTRTLIWRIQHLIEQGQDPTKICAVSFTNAAAFEIRKRLAETTSLHHMPVALGYNGTLHGFALRELQRYGEPLGYRSSITVLDEEAAEEMLKAAAEETGCKAGIKTLKEARREFTRYTRGTMKHARGPEELAVSHFLRKMRMTSTADFDALIEDYATLLHAGHPSSHFDHLIVDEVQDSGDVDMDIYERMPAGKRFFIGDPDQAIYSFRGGEVKHILALAASPSWKTYLLEGNYRCRDAICRAANRLISHAGPERVQKWTWAQVHDEKGAWAVSRPYPTSDDEARSLMHLIREQLNDGTAPEEIAVLARTNAIVKQIRETAQASGIPVAQKKHRRPPAEWRKMLAAIEYLNDPTSDVAAGRWLRADEGLQAFQKLEIRTRVNLERLAENVSKKYPMIMNATPANIGQALARYGIGKGTVERAEEWVRTAQPESLSELLLILQREGLEADEMTPGVTISTIHGAKGREWDTVFLAGFENEVIPGRGDMKEERRLAYVGVTRARRRLVITHAQARKSPWGQQEMKPASRSRFLEELQKPWAGATK